MRIRRTIRRRIVFSWLRHVRVESGCYEWSDNKGAIVIDEREDGDDRKMEEIPRICHVLESCSALLCRTVLSIPVSSTHGVGQRLSLTRIRPIRNSAGTDNLGTVQLLGLIGGISHNHLIVDEVI